MSMNKKPIKSNQNEEHVQQLAQYLLLLRKVQDKSGAELLESLGGLSMQELTVLNIIGDREPCIMRDIAKHASLSLSSVTVIVDKLVKGKLVKRVRSEEDRRIVHGSLTSEGRRIYQIQIAHLYASIRKMLDVLTPDEQKSLLNIFQKITQASLS